MLKFSAKLHIILFLLVCSAFSHAAQQEAQEKISLSLPVDPYDNAELALPVDRDDPTKTMLLNPHFCPANQPRLLWKHILQKRTHFFIQALITPIEGQFEFHYNSVKLENNPRRVVTYKIQFKDGKPYVDQLEWNQRTPQLSRSTLPVRSESAAPHHPHAMSPTGTYRHPLHTSVPVQHHTMHPTHTLSSSVFPVRPQYAESPYVLSLPVPAQHSMHSAGTYGQSPYAPFASQCPYEMLPTHPSSFLASPASPQYAVSHMSLSLLTSLPTTKESFYKELNDNFVEYGFNGAISYLRVLIANPFLKEDIVKIAAPALAKLLKHYRTPVPVVPETSPMPALAAPENSPVDTPAIIVSAAASPSVPTSPALPVATSVATPSIPQAPVAPENSPVPVPVALETSPVDAPATPAVSTEQPTTPPAIASAAASSSVATAPTLPAPTSSSVTAETPAPAALKTSTTQVPVKPESSPVLPIAPPGLVPNEINFPALPTPKPTTLVKTPAAQSVQTSKEKAPSPVDTAKPRSSLQTDVSSASSQPVSHAKVSSGPSSKSAKRSQKPTPAQASLQTEIEPAPATSLKPASSQTFPVHVQKPTTQPVTPGLTRPATKAPSRPDSSSQPSTHSSESSDAASIQKETPLLAQLKFPDAAVDVLAAQPTPSPSVIAHVTSEIIAPAPAAPEPTKREQFEPYSFVASTPLGPIGRQWKGKDGSAAEEKIIKDLQKQKRKAAKEAIRKFIERNDFADLEDGLKSYDKGLQRELILTSIGLLSNVSSDYRFEWLCEYVKNLLSTDIGDTALTQNERYLCQTFLEHGQRLPDLVSGKDHPTEEAAEYADTTSQALQSASTDEKIAILKGPNGELVSINSKDLPAFISESKKKATRKHALESQSASTESAAVHTPFPDALKKLKEALTDCSAEQAKKEAVEQFLATTSNLKELFDVLQDPELKDHIGFILGEISKKVQSGDLLWLNEQTLRDILSTIFQKSHTTRQTDPSQSDDLTTTPLFTPVPADHTASASRSDVQVEEIQGQCLELAIKEFKKEFEHKEYNLISMIQAVSVTEHHKVQEPIFWMAVLETELAQQLKIIRNLKVYADAFMPRLKTALKLSQNHNHKAKLHELQRTLSTWDALLSNETPGDDSPKCNPFIKTIIDAALDYLAKEQKNIKKKPSVKMVYNLLTQTSDKELHLLNVAISIHGGVLLHDLQEMITKRPKDDIKEETKKTLFFNEFNEPIAAATARYSATQSGEEKKAAVDEIVSLVKGISPDQISLFMKALKEQDLPIHHDVMSSIIKSDITPAVRTKFMKTYQAHFPKKV